jgi:hypothetical protein
MEHAKVNGVELGYEVVGSGEPMLLIQGAHGAVCASPGRRLPAMQSGSSKGTGEWITVGS